MVGASAAAAAAVFGGVLPPGITGTNERSTLLVSNLNPEVKLRGYLLSGVIDYWNSNLGSRLQTLLLWTRYDNYLLTSLTFPSPESGCRQTLQSVFQLW